MTTSTEKQFVPLNIAVLTVSDTRTLDTDSSGDTLIQRLEEAGHRLVARDIVKDDIYLMRARISQWIADVETQVILMTGGTGFSHRDSTPEAVAPCWTRASTALVSYFANCHMKRSAPLPSSPGRWPVWQTAH